MTTEKRSRTRRPYTVSVTFTEGEIYGLQRLAERTGTSLAGALRALLIRETRDDRQLTLAEPKGDNGQG